MIRLAHEVEPKRLGDQARPERHSQPGGGRSRLLQNALEDEHQRRRRHIAEVPQHAARPLQSVGTEFQSLLDRIEDRSTARMDRPNVEVLLMVSAQDALIVIAHCLMAQRLGNLLWNLAGQGHGETGFADAPRDEIARMRNCHDTKILEGDALRLCGDETCRASVAEEQRGEDNFEIGRLLQVEGAELEIDHQNLRGRLGANDVMRSLQGVDGGRASHEPDHRAFDGGIQSQAFHELLIEPRCGEAGAGCHHHVSDGRALFVDIEGLDGALRELHRVGFEPSHASGRAGKLSGPVESVAIGRDLAFVAGFKGRVTVFDFSALGHAPHEKLGLSIGEELIDETDEGLVDIVLGYGRTNPVDVRNRHKSHPADT
jgi:hypothetical protein